MAILSKPLSLTILTNKVPIYVLQFNVTLVLAHFKWPFFQNRCVWGCFPPEKGLCGPALTVAEYLAGVDMGIGLAMSILVQLSNLATRHVKQTGYNNYALTTRSDGKKPYIYPLHNYSFTPSIAILLASSRVWWFSISGKLITKPGTIYKMSEDG